MITLGNITIQGKAVLAPMAGVTDRAFRELCMGFGAAFCVSEMVSAKALTMGDKKTAGLLGISPGEQPMAIQLFGYDPATMAEGARIAVDSLPVAPAAIDINMGCPAPKIVNNHSGSALMKDPALCGRIVEAVARAVDLPVTVKMRKGWDAASVNAVEVAKICEAAGAKMIAIHGRTREQMYAPPADWNIIAAVKQAVDIPVVGNGDIYCARDAMQMMEQTGCDLVMVGRGAMGNPWIFREINAQYALGRPVSPPGLYERLHVMNRHIIRLCACKGEPIGMREARKHTAWYMKGLRGAARLRVLCGELRTLDDMKRLTQAVIEENDPDAVSAFS